MPPVDMSPEAVTARLRRVDELNRLCRSLAKAGRDARDNAAAGTSARQSPKDSHGPELS